MDVQKLPSSCVCGGSPRICTFGQCWVDCPRCGARGPIAHSPDAAVDGWDLIMSRPEQRVPLTAKRDCERCKGSGVVMAEVYVPMESLRAGVKNYVPKERKLCGCVRADHD